MLRDLIGARRVLVSLAVAAAALSAGVVQVGAASGGATWVGANTVTGAGGTQDVAFQAKAAEVNGALVITGTCQAVTQSVNVASTVVDCFIQDQTAGNVNTYGPIVRVPGYVAGGAFLKSELNASHVYLFCVAAGYDQLTGGGSYFWNGARCFNPI